MSGSTGQSEGVSRYVIEFYFSVMVTISEHVLTLVNFIIPSYYILYSYTYMFETFESYVSNVCYVEFFVLKINILEKHLPEENAKYCYDYAVELSVTNFILCFYSL
jgi:hypothetical protein